MKLSKKGLSAITIIGILSVALFFTYRYMKDREEDTNNKYQLIYIPKTQDKANDFWTSLLEGTQEAADEYQVDLKVVSPASEDDYEGQKELILEAIEERPDAILISPCRYIEETETARKVKEAGIKLILIDSFLNEHIEDAAVTTDNTEAGTKMGEYAKEFLIGDVEPVIGIISHVKGSSTAFDREEGLRLGLGSYSDHIVGRVYSNSTYEEAFDVTVELLKKNPDINLIFGLNEYSSVGAARAIREMGLSEQVKMVGFDSSKEEIRLLEEGVFSAIIIQEPFVMGYLGVEKAVQVVNGENSSEKVDSGSIIITKENMYTEENQKLLFPFWDK
ncbi:MAG TPA: substrate-binding domain-containing protein [Candidatus Pelethocola excrementipullorum]|nr:substrate-binding domain-containing protein [Candidatus Pelethocola excrementipullorum]